MLNVAIIISKDDRKSYYINQDAMKLPQPLAPFHHKMRVKAVIYGLPCGHYIYRYNKDMDFTAALNAGWEIDVDLRND